MLSRQAHPKPVLTIRRLGIFVAIAIVILLFWRTSPKAPIAAWLSCPPPPPFTPLVHLRPASHVNVLITGGAGYIGSHMAMRLLLDPTVVYSVIIVDDLSRGDRRQIDSLRDMADDAQRSLHFIQTDVADAANMTSIMRQHAIELVIHFAGFAYPSESVADPLLYYDNIVTRTQRLLDAMGAAGVRRLVYSSSSAVYGTITDARCNSPLKEWSTLNPMSPYGEAKLMSEQVIRAFARSRHAKGEQFSAMLLRYFNVIGADPLTRIGPMPKPQFARFTRIVDSCLESAITGQPIELFGEQYATHDGSPIRDYIHVLDLVDAHLHLADVVHGQQVDVFNIGLGLGYSVREVLSACATATGRPMHTVVRPERPGDPPIVLGDTTKLMREFHWKPKYTDLTAAIQTGWKWRQKLEQNKKQ